MASMSPLQLIAGAELANNQGITIGTDLTQAVNSYRSSSLIAPFASTLANSQTQSLLGNTYGNLLTLSATNCPALSDSTPTASAANIGVILANSAAAGNSVLGFTSIIKDIGNIYLGSGDNSVFAQVFTSADGYLASANDYILTSKNSATYLGSSFTSMNSLITGNLDEVNLAFIPFGQDLKNLGTAIDLENLNNLGYPSTLLQQIVETAGLTPSLTAALAANNISPTAVFDLPAPLLQRLTFERTLYDIFINTTKNNLKEVLDILSVTTTGLNSLADLLNPVKFFPNSFFSLTVKTVDGVRGIYLTDSGSINTGLINSLPEYALDDYQQLSRVVPPDQALALQCLKISLQQIKNIANLTLSELANSYLKLVTTKDLALINALTEPVPQSVVDFYAATFSTGSGPDGTLVLGDVIGAAAGIGYTDKISNTVILFNTVADDANFSNLTVIYQRMNTTITGGYGDASAGPVIIPAGPAQGTYTDTFETVTPEEGDPFEVLIETAGGNAFRTGLIPNAQSFINSFVSANPTAANTLNSDWTSMAQKLISENNNLREASIEIDELIPNQKSAVLSFVQNLPNYGLDTTANGTSVFLEQVANPDTLGGQAIIATLRQGRNVAALDAAGIGNDINIPTDFSKEPEQANIAGIEFTQSDAAGQIIR